MFGVLTETIGVCLQEDRLWIADPKAVNHILHKSGYLYARPIDIRERSAVLTDRGILWAHGELSITTTPGLSNNFTGDVHKRHRRAMAPAFGLVEAKGLLPYFMDTVNKAHEFRLHLVSNADQSPRYQMADKWNGMIENSESGNSVIIDVNRWLGKATLDA